MSDISAELSVLAAQTLTEASVIGPVGAVGVVAVAVGAGGVLLGLVRRRKVAVVKAAADAPVRVPAPRSPVPADERQAG